MEYYEPKMGISHMVHVSQCGREECLPGHRYGPAVRDHFLIHYVSTGKGIFMPPGGAVHQLSAGQGFIIFPGDVTTYQADYEQPWHYAWIGYDGPDAPSLTAQVGLSHESPIFSAGPAEEITALLHLLYNQAGEMRMGQMAAVGGLFQFMAHIGEESARQVSASLEEEYFMKARWFIEGNYHRPIRIADVADYVGLSRSQLFRVFTGVTNQSPKQYLTSLRLRQALPLLESKVYSIDEIAASVGIDSPSRFTEQFRSAYGTTPSRWKRR